MNGRRYLCFDRDCNHRMLHFTKPVLAQCYDKDMIQIKTWRQTLT
jgi:hypothetical protein